MEAIVSMTTDTLDAIHEFHKQLTRNPLPNIGGIPGNLIERIEPQTFDDIIEYISVARGSLPSRLSISAPEPTSYWDEIHRYIYTTAEQCAQAYKQWEANIPNFTCGCRAAWKEIIARPENKPDFSSAKAYFEWGVARHNDVNRKPNLNKPIISLSQARQMHDYYAVNVTQQDPMDLLAVTSLSPGEGHKLRQPKCLDSWKLFGLDIASVNTAEEIKRMRDVYPQVDYWIAKEQPETAYNKKTQRIVDLTSVASEMDRTVLLVNSDIEIYGEQSTLLDPINAGKLPIGIRWNYSEDYHHATREPWGLDAFVFTPDAARALPSLDFAIGKPAWDYWIPYHLQTNGVELEFIVDKLFYHRSHALNWSADEWQIGTDIFLNHYGLSSPNWSTFRNQWQFAKGK